MKVLTAFVVAALALPSTATASTKELDTAVLRATHYGIQAMPKADRRELATAALAYWKNFDSRIPRNSPTAADWLKKEMSTTDKDRVARVTATPEYALFFLSKKSEGCVTVFDQLVQSLDAIPLRELYLWTKTLGCYNSTSDFLIYLQRAGLSNGEWDGPFSVQHFGLFHDTVTGPLANAIFEEGAKLP